METALPGSPLFPPPASGPHRLAGGNRPGAWRTADTRVTLPVERVNRHIVFRQKGIQSDIRPIMQRRTLRDAGERVMRDRLDVATHFAMGATQPGNPDRLPLQRTAQRLQLTNFTTMLALRNTFTKSIDAVDGHPLFNRGRLGKKHSNSQTISFFGLRNQIERLRR